MTHSIILRQRKKTIWKVLIARLALLENFGHVHTTPEELKNSTITGHFGFVFEETSIRGIL